MDSALDVIKVCTVNDKIVKLPPFLQTELNRAVRNQVAKKLGNIGGKWNEQVGGFVFTSDPTELLAQLTGEPIPAAKPDPVAAISDELVRRAAIRENQRILIPCAGVGAILRAIDRAMPDSLTDHTEQEPENRDYLSLHFPWSELVGQMFIQFDRPNHYHRIVAIPPLDDCKDLLNIRWMYRQLAPRGRLVSLVCMMGQEVDSERWAGFIEWLGQVQGELIELDENQFHRKKLGIVVIDRKSK